MFVYVAIILRCLLVLSRFVLNSDVVKVLKDKVQDLMRLMPKLKIKDLSS